MTARSKLPKPPPSLIKGGGGEQLWFAMHETYNEWEPDRLIILQAACETQDVIDRLSANWHEAPTIAVGAQKQPVVHPSAAEARHSRAELARLLKAALAVTATEAAADDGYSSVAGAGRPVMSRTDSARKAANSRWSRTRAVGN